VFVIVFIGIITILAKNIVFMPEHVDINKSLYININDLEKAGYSIIPCKAQGCKKYTIEGFDEEMVVFIDKPVYRKGGNIYETDKCVIKVNNNVFIPIELADQLKHSYLVLGKVFFIKL
jgi:hypothetical protein